MGAFGSALLHPLLPDAQRQGGATREGDTPSGKRCRECGAAYESENASHNCHDEAEFNSRRDRKLADSRLQRLDLVRVVRTQSSSLRRFTRQDLATRATVRPIRSRNDFLYKKSCGRTKDSGPVHG